MYNLIYFLNQQLVLVFNNRIINTCSCAYLLFHYLIHLHVKGHDKTSLENLRWIFFELGLEIHVCLSCLVDSLGLIGKLSCQCRCIQLSQVLGVRQGERGGGRNVFQDLNSFRDCLNFSNETHSLFWKRNFVLLNWGIKTRSSIALQMTIPLPDP